MAGLSGRPLASSQRAARQLPDPKITSPNSCKWCRRTSPIASDAKLILNDRYGFPFVHIETDFKRPSRMGEHLDLTLLLMKIGLSSLNVVIVGHLAGVERLRARLITAPRAAARRDVVEDVAARTGGVPLFVEEVTRLLLERGEGGGGIRDIPATLQQSLMARLDRLGPSRARWRRSAR